MRAVLALTIVLITLLPGLALPAGASQDDERRMLIDAEVPVGRGETWQQCADIEAGTLYTRIVAPRVPLPESFRVDLSRAEGAYAAPLLVTTATADETFAVHRVEAGTYCLRASLSKRPELPVASGASRAASMEYGIIQLHLVYGPPR